MNMKNQLPPEMQDRIDQVKKDNMDYAQGPVAEERVAEDVDMINPDVNTLDRG